MLFMTSYLASLKKVCVYLIHSC